jgi:hypothetical protein
MLSVDALLEAADEVQAFCQAQGWRFCYIGGLAVLRWGEPRLTQDIDLTLLTGFGNEEHFIGALLGPFESRVDDPISFSLQARVVLLRTRSGVPVDIALGGFPFEERSVARASDWDRGKGKPVITCSAEDLLVHKVFAGRPLDWGDVERVLTRQKCELDLKLIRSELRELLPLKDALPNLETFERTLNQVRNRLGIEP